MRGGGVKGRLEFVKNSSNLVAGPFPNRHNHLGDSHIIGRLLKPHMTMTIFMNFAARHSLVKPEDSIVQNQFSVKSALILPYSLSFHTKSLSIQWTGQFPPCLTNHIHRWEEMELWSWSLMRCQTNTSGRTWPSQGWWKRKDSLKTRLMGWNSITTGKCKVWERFVRL